MIRWSLLLFWRLPRLDAMQSVSSFALRGYRVNCSTLIYGAILGVGPSQTSHWRRMGLADLTAAYAGFLGVANVAILFLTRYRRVMASG